MKDFMMLFHSEPDPNMEPTPAEIEAEIKEWMDWIGGIGAQGKLKHPGEALGFEGKYRMEGRDALERVKIEAYNVIRRHRGEERDRTLSSQWQGLGNTKRTLANYIPMWVVISIVVALMFFSYAGFRYWLYESATPVVQDLQTIAAPPETP